MEFFTDSFLVQLFSNPQHTQASRTNIEPVENEKLLISVAERIILATVTSIIPTHSRFGIISLTTHRAITLVATISKLLRSDAFAAVVIVSPIIKKMGAAISSTTISMV